MPLRNVKLLVFLATLLPMTGCQLISTVFHKKKEEIRIVPPDRTVTVTGMVSHSGEFVIPDLGGLTIQKAMALAGGVRTSAITRVEEPAMIVKDYSTVLGSLAVTLRRGSITYVIPAPLIDNTEYGHMRLIDRDVIAIVPLEDAGFGKSPAVTGNSGDVSQVSFQGATILRGQQLSLRELSPRIDGKTLFNASIEKRKNVIDDTLGALPTVARVTRRATRDGLPRVLIIPIQQSAGETLPEYVDTIYTNFRARGGDTIAYLPPGTDPLLIISGLAESRIRRIRRQLR